MALESAAALRDEGFPVPDEELRWRVTGVRSDDTLASRRAGRNFQDVVLLRRD